MDQRLFDGKAPGQVLHVGTLLQVFAQARSTRLDSLAQRAAVELHGEPFAPDLRGSAPAERGARQVDIERVEHVAGRGLEVARCDGAERIQPSAVLRF